MIKKVLLFSAIIAISLQSVAQWLAQATGITASSHELNHVLMVDDNLACAAAYDRLDPEISVNPTALSEVLEPNAASVQVLSISNIGEDDLNFTIEIDFIGKRGQKQQYHFLELDFAYGNTANAETDPSATPREVENTLAMWDLQFVYDVQTSSAMSNHAGSETDGEYIYTAVWIGPSINKFALDGTFIETFTIPGVTGIRDLAFDGEFFYGSNAVANTGIWKMDFVNEVLVSTIPYTGAVRAIAYDEAADGFWVNNWSTALTLVSRTGTILLVGPTTPSCYGIAYDELSPGGPYMWLFTGTITDLGCQVEQMTMPDGTLTGVSHSISGEHGAQHLAGGLWIYPDLFEGTITLGGCTQGEPNKIFGYEIIAITPPPDDWLYTAISTGTVGAGQTLDVMVTFDATGLDYGDYEAVLQITSNDPGNPTVSVPATLIVSYFLPPTIVVNPGELMQQIVPNQIETQEMTIGNIGEGPLSYYINIEYVESTSPEENVITYQALSWLSVSPESGIVEPMAEDIVTVTFNSAGLEIKAYYAYLLIESNDPDNFIIEVPVTFDYYIGINALGEPNAVMVYPNPATGFLHVQANRNIREIKVFNSTGQLVISTLVNDKTININTNGLTPGMYHLQIESEAGTSNQKVMVR
ncbi:MAG: T9SS type A sorting domain-containing protein [Bacteroidales bacterium]|nr:T9SS type A sorting domain-containing protein [Bacteroidales bacterium]